MLNSGHSCQKRTVLLATDNKNSVLAEIVADTTHRRAYSTYGHQSVQHEVMAGVGFNGQLREPRIGWYFLGNGYRVYNPRLMRFHSPDSWSPFGAGGLNAYAYCVGDPVNCSDPTGHVGLFKLLTGQSRSVSRSPSTSSLSPLISNNPSVPPVGYPPTSRLQGTARGVTNPGLVENAQASMPRYENIPTNTEKRYTAVTIQNPTTSRLRGGAPPPIPSRQQPRFNDTGGQAGIISPNWKENEDYRYHKVWSSKPFERPFAPVPPTRTLSDGSTLHYRVNYDSNGNPHQSSVQKFDVSQLQNALRNVRN
ncbi:RHS repeat-associated core domain-containing protein [Rhodococcus sp. IEGM1300]